MNALWGLYRWRYASVLVYMLQKRRYRFWPFLTWYWQTQNFDTVIRDGGLVRTRPAWLLLIFLRIGMTVQLLAGLTLLSVGLWRDIAGGWQFGAALILSYPVLWAHLLIIPLWAARLSRPKQLGRSVVCHILERQVQHLRARHNIKVVAIVGSVGKTSTKAAIAATLSASHRVLWQEGNYNDRVTVPLIFFNQPEPNITNIFAWLRIFARNARTIKGPYPYDVVVAEIGPDGPGQTRDFAYLAPDLVVLTAITPEHMEFFGTLDAVAAEELTMLDFSQQALVNSDDVPAKYLEGRTYTTYGLHPSATYCVSERRSKGLKGQTATFCLGKDHQFKATVSLLGEQGAKVAIAAAAVAHLLGAPLDKIAEGVAAIQPFAGRMRIFDGIKHSTLIDDTYNASPIAVTAALDVLYASKAPQRIAILGSMNELGDYSPEAHREVGGYCDPKKLDRIVVIGSEARTYLAPAAEAKGCTVTSFDSPFEAGEFVKSRLKPKAVVLAKGSQNRVFAEEALKLLLADPADASKLVRQSAYWLKHKHKQFKK